MNKDRYNAALNAAYQILKTIPQLDTPAVATVAMAIAAATEAALDYRPGRLADPLTAALPPAVWTCGCTAAGCAIRWDHYSDAGTRSPRQQGVRVTCVAHSLVARTVTDEQEGHSLTHARARAMALLDQAHTEQCR